MLTFAVMLLLGFLVIVGRLIYIQVFQHEDLLSKAQEKTRRTYLREVDGNPVALTVGESVSLFCLLLSITFQGQVVTNICMGGLLSFRNMLLNCVELRQFSM